MTLIGAHQPYASSDQSLQESACVPERPYTVHLLARLKHGGISSQLVELLRRWDHDRMGHVVCSISSPAEYQDEVRATGARLIDLGHTPDRSLLTLVSSLRRLIKSIRPTTIHMNMRFDRRVGLLASLATSAQKVVTLHAPLSSRSKGLTDYLLDRVLTGIAVDRVVCISDTTLRDSRLPHPWLRRYRAQVIHNGIDVGGWSASPPLEDVRLIRAELLPTPRSRMILCVGRLVRKKGHELLIPFMKRLLSRCPDACLFIAGDGEERARLEGLIADARLGRHIRLLGARRDVRLLLHASDLFVFPSYWEPFGLSLVEAMASGTPVLASRIPNLEEVVGDLQDRVLFPVGDPGALAKMAAALLADPGGSKALGNRLRTRAETFKIETTARRLEAIYLAPLMN